MKKYLSYIVTFTAILIGLSSCHTSAPRLDYKALAQASVRLGVDIELRDNHKLYIHASEWIGTPYRAGGDSKRGTDCSGVREIWCSSPAVLPARKWHMWASTSKTASLYMPVPAGES